MSGALVIRAVRTFADRVRAPGRAAPSERDLAAVAFVLGAGLTELLGIVPALIVAVVAGVGTAIGTRLERRRRRDGRRR